ncbi:hypothetical protein [Zavarzinella formosa]|uniref:hypothetical protein n=1 Tax=Zavarzinella formosa TaxID=360055 RepID=UPI0002E607A5|nr:hypothetical protein [Zavarzinella formosa]
MTKKEQFTSSVYAYLDEHWKTNRELPMLLARWIHTVPDESEARSKFVKKLMKTDQFLQRAML